MTSTKKKEFITGFLLGVAIGVPAAYLLAWLVWGWKYSEAVTNIFVAIGTIGLAIAAIWRDLLPSFFINRQRRAESEILLREAFNDIKVKASALNAAIDMKLGGELETMEEAIAYYGENSAQLDRFEKAVRSAKDVFFDGVSLEHGYVCDFQKSISRYEAACKNARNAGVITTYENIVSTYWLTVDRLRNAGSVEYIDRALELQKAAYRQLEDSPVSSLGLIVSAGS